jgi:hypothetical protein
MWHDAVENAIQECSRHAVCVRRQETSNRDAGFARDVPASLHLPNLIAVGAVNRRGMETGFSSYGDTVVVYMRMEIRLIVMFLAGRE